MAEGGQNTENLQPEAPKDPSTKVSKGFLGEMAHRVKEKGIDVALNMVPGGAYASAFRREELKREATMAQAGLTAKPSKVERPWSAYIRDKRSREAEMVKSVTSTEASKGFLSKFKDRFLGDNEGTGVKVLRAVATSILAREAIKDAIQGNYPSAAVGGVLAAASAVSFARLSLRFLKDTSKE